MNKYKDIPKTNTDTFLIGAGIMSTTLAVLLKELKPDMKIMITERLSDAGLESSHSLNNAGTGHAGYCEMNYTPEDIDGNIDISKAIKVNKAFEKSKDFWDYLMRMNKIKSDFLNRVPHMNFVSGEDNVLYLKKRYETLRTNKAFEKMEFTTDVETIKKWIPLVMNGRDLSIPVAATRIVGFDVDFGKLTKNLVNYLRDTDTIITYTKEVIDLYKENGKWNIIQKDMFSDKLSRIECDFVFIGAGGAAITLLEKSGIPEAKGYGGFPVSGEWLICSNPEIVSQHFAKVYGRPSIGSPPMSVPHLDTRIINNRKCLLFGPYAGLSTKFLKNGSWLDFFKSIRLSNIGIMLDAGLRNIPLTKYLMSELFKNKSARFKVLQSYYPNANSRDWKLEVAGQRVQVIKKENGKGTIEFGTEIVSSQDGSIAALLGASPGASTAVKIMLDVVERCIDVDDDIQYNIMKIFPNYYPSVYKTI